MAGGEGATAVMCTPAFVGRVLRSRWYVVFASMVVMAASGSTYIFALYSKELRSVLGYNQQTLNTLGFFKDLGTNVGVVSGLVQQVAPTWAVLLIGAGMNLAGYLKVYM